MNAVKQKLGFALNPDRDRVAPLSVVTANLRFRCFPCPKIALIDFLVDPPVSAEPCRCDQLSLLGHFRTAWRPIQ